MARERLWWGGIDVATWAVRAIDLSGLLQVPERRGENIDVDGRHGQIRVPRKRYGGRELVVEFWVRGTDAGGVIPADPPAQFYTNLATVGRLCAQDASTLTHQLPDGTTREISVEVIAAVAPDRFKTGDLAKVKVAFASAEAFWRATTATTMSTSMANAATRALTEWASSDAPVDELVVTLGPGAGPRLDMVESGLWMRYNATIGSGQTLVVDCGAKSLSGTGGLTPDRTLLQVHPSDGRWLAIDPRVTGSATLKMTHGSGAATVPVTIVARQKWMFG